MHRVIPVFGIVLFSWHPLAAQDSQHALAEPNPAWNGAFREADPRWRGADAAYSVSLEPGKTLWLFGDSWITAVDAESRAGGTLVRNSVAIQHFENGAPHRPVYYWRQTTPRPSAAFLSDDDDSWLWPLSGFQHGEKLYLFMSKLVHSDEGMGFAAAGNVLVAVENPDATPSEWTMRHYDIPYFETTEHGDRVFGCASVVENDDVYVYGIREDWRRGFGGRDIIVARTSIVRLTSGEEVWKFFDGTTWQEHVEKASALFDEGAAEMSVHFDAHRERFVAIYTRFGLSDEIMLRTAPRPEGPWNSSHVVYRCPDGIRNENYFSYAAKAHPELSANQDELLVTYAVNSLEFADHVRDPDLYWPKFVTIDLGRAMGGELRHEKRD